MSDEPSEAAGAGGEEAFVAWLRRATGKHTRIGDDTADLGAPKKGHKSIVTVDQQIEGTHFLEGLPPETLGRRLLRVNLSDLAAAGATPRYAFLALGLPESADPKPIVKGLLRDAKRYGVTLAGGDLANAVDLTASLTLIGEKKTAEAPLTRDRAKPGHAIWLGGTVGESALGCEILLRGATTKEKKERSPEKGVGVDLSGLAETDLPAGLTLAAKRAVLRNVLPEPQLELGRWLASLGERAGACIDLSDGLGKDLARVATASRVGAEIDLPALHRATAPRHDALAEALGLDPLAAALAGGEDYVLLFTLPATVVPPPRFHARKVGTITRSRRLTMIDREGGRHDLPRIGWDHLQN